MLFSFGFTHCPNVCPTTLSDLAKVYRALPAKDRTKVQVLFVSVDPHRDKPETMKNYVPYFDDSFIGLTGTEAALAEAAKAYGAYYEISPRFGSQSGCLHGESFGADLLNQSGREMEIAVQFRSTQ